MHDLGVQDPSTLERNSSQSSIMLGWVGARCRTQTVIILHPKDVPINSLIVSRNMFLYVKKFRGK